MPYNIDVRDTVVFNHYFADIEASTSEFQNAVLPLLNSDWDKNSELLIAKLQSFVERLDNNIYRECIEATKNYINSRDFMVSNKYETTSYFYGALQYDSETQTLKNLNQKLNQLMQDIPKQNTSWRESLENLCCKTASTLFSAFDFAKEHPLSTITALLYGQVALASAFPAVFNLSSLDGINGFKINGEAKDDYSGYSVSSAGDFNGDGIADLIIGASGVDPGGSSYVIFGKNERTWTMPFELSTLDGTNGFKINGEETGGSSGGSVSSAGDINGDGIDDLVIGASYAGPNGNSFAGSSYVIFGKNDTWITPFELSTLNGTNGFKINGEAAFDRSGFSVSSVGDINRDGIDDLIIGAFGADPNGNSFAGSSYVIFGKTSAWTTPLELSALNGIDGLKINGEASPDSSGISVSSAGDINGDGVDDLIIGAYFAAPNEKEDAGSSYVIFGKTEAWTTPFELSSLNGANGFRINGEADHDFSGCSVSRAGDINGDGIDDVVIGAYGAEVHGNGYAGASYVIFGKNETWTTPFELSTLNGTNGFKINGEESLAYSGHSVSSGGDINGDGIDDLVIGAYQADPNDKFNAGSSYVVFGKNGTWTTPFELSTLNGTNGFKINGEMVGDWSGRSVSSAGDINGDGIDDLIIGADGADPNDTNRAGSSYVIFAAHLPSIVTGNSSSIVYVENEPAKIIDNSTVITSADNWNFFMSAVVSIINNFQLQEDELNFVDQNGIMGFYNGTTGVLTLTGSSALANYQAALRNITYHNLSDNPTITPRNISFIVNDRWYYSLPFIRTINIIPVNDAPVLANDGGGFNYTENDPATIIDSSITISDVDNVNLNNATVAITNNFYYPEDILIFMDQNGISGIYNNATGVLTLTGSSTIANYQTALRSITYEDSSDNPTADVRTITFRANDGVDNSNAVTRNINIIPVNDAPVLSSDGGSFNYTENDPETIIDSSISITDADSVDLTNATIAITNNFHYPEDILIFMDQNGISGLYNNVTGVLALTGSSSLVNYQSALCDVKYKNLENNPIAATRTITFIVNGGVEKSNTVTRDINIIAVNDAPVLANDGGSFDYTENDPATIIDPSIIITDVDNVNLTNAAVGITNNFNLMQDVLNFTDQNGIVGSYYTETGILTLTGSSSVANYQIALRNVTYINLSDHPTTDLRTVTFTVNDGIGNSNTITRDINIIPVNAAPILTNNHGSFNYTENDPATIIDSNIIITDVDNANLANATIAITSNFHYPEDVLTFMDQNGVSGFYNDATGVLALTGSSSIAHYQIALRNVTYINLSDHPTTDLRTVAFMVNDGIENSNAITRDINVIPVQDVSTITLNEAALNYTENSGVVAIDPTLTVVDLDNVNLTGGVVSIANNFDSEQDVLIFIDQNDIAGSYNDTTGILSLAGSSSVPNYQTALRSVEYENLSENPTTNSRTISFVVDDGVKTSAPAVRNINIIPINTAPVLINNGVRLNYTENDPATIVDSSITVFDADNINLAGATVSISGNFDFMQDRLSFTNQNNIIGSYNSALGILTLSGSSNITNYQTALRSVRYNNLSENPTAFDRTVSFIVSDGEASSIVVTRVIHIIPIHDLPVITVSGSTLSYTEKESAKIIDSNINIVDLDSADLYWATVSIVNNFNSAQDILSFINQNGITGSYNNETGILTLTGTSSVINYQVALRDVKYENLSDKPTTDPRSIAFVVNDGFVSSVPAVRNITIIPINDTPSTDDSGFFDFGSKLFNTILLASIGGLIGFLFLALRICLYRKATQSFEKLTSIGDVSTTEQQKKFQTDILRPIAQAIFDRIKITGCFGYISDKRMQDYLSAVTQLIVALQQQAINVDLDNLSPASQSLLINVIAKQTENVLLPAQGCCTFGACCRCIGRLCSAEISPEVLEAKVVAIAIAIKSALKRNNYDTFLSRQSVGGNNDQNQPKTYEAPIEMAVLGGGLYAKSGDAPLSMPVNRVSAEKPIFVPNKTNNTIPANIENPMLSGKLNSDVSGKKACAIDAVRIDVMSEIEPILDKISSPPRKSPKLQPRPPKSPRFFKPGDSDRPQITSFSKGLDEKQVKQNVFRV